MARAPSARSRRSCSSTWSRASPRCELLAKSVCSGPLEVNLEFPYHPHVTIAHHRPEEILDRAFNELAGFECEFEVREFHLYAFDNGAGWVPRRAFRLVG